MQEFDIEMQLDEDALEVRAKRDLPIDEPVSLLGRRNRIAVKLMPGRRIQFANHGRDAMVFLIRLIAHPNPGCQFSDLMLSADFSPPGKTCPTVEVVVEDMQPQQIMGKEPVKMRFKHKEGLSLKCEFQAFNGGAALEDEANMEYQTYYPELIGSGVGFSEAVWTIQPLPGKQLYLADQDFLIIVSFPETIQSLVVEITIQTQLELKDVPCLMRFPFIGKRKVNWVCREDIG